ELYFFFFSSRRRHTSFSRDWSSDVCSSDLPRTWYRPLNCPVFSIAITSRISSTTQTIDPSRFGFAHISQSSTSEILLQFLQNLILFFKLSRESANLTVCSVGLFNRCSANLNAVRLPIPGNWEIS